MILEAKLFLFLTLFSSTKSCNSLFVDDLWIFSNYFLIRRLKLKQLYLFTLDKREEKQIDFDWSCLLCKFQLSQYWASSSRLISFVHHVVGDAKLDAQEKLFAITTFSGFIGLCRVNII